MKEKILVLFGGVSTEHEISRVSASFVAENLDGERYEIHKMGITKSGAWYLYEGAADKIKDGTWENDTESLIPAVLSPCALHHGIMALDKSRKKYDIIRIDCAFPVLHGKNGEDGTVQGLLTLAGIPFVGCSTYSSAVCMDKVAAKILCEREGIKTSPFIFARNKEDFDYTAFALKAEEAFGYPVFVKPANAGSSVGITKAKDRDRLIAGILKAFEYDTKILIEKAMKGKEIEVAVIGNTAPFASLCGEIDPQAEFYDYDTKYVTDTARFYIPAGISETASKKVRRSAETIFASLDCSGLARVDFFVDGEEVVFNEINTIPGFTAISMYPKLMKCEGRDHSRLLDELISLAEAGK